MPIRHWRPTQYNSSQFFWQRFKTCKSFTLILDSVVKTSQIILQHCYHVNIYSLNFSWWPPSLSGDQSVKESLSSLTFTWRITIKLQTTLGISADFTALTKKLHSPKSTAILYNLLNPQHSYTCTYTSLT